MCAAGAKTVLVRGNGVLPAAGALLAFGVFNTCAKLTADSQFDLGNDEEVSNIFRFPFSKECILGRNGEVDLCFKAFTYLLLCACSFKHAVDSGADLDNAIPLCHCFVREGIACEGLGHLVEENIALIIFATVGHGQPNFIAGEAEDGSKHLSQRREHQIEGALRAAAGSGISFIAV